MNRLVRHAAPALLVIAMTIGATANQAAAEIAVSTKNSPSGQIGQHMGGLLGLERKGIERLPDGALGAIATGPAKAEPKVKATKIVEKKSQPKVDPGLRYDDAWLFAQAEPQGGADWQCLTEALYFESRGESIKGQFAVAEVILNRVDSGLYPRSVCAVIKQRGSGACAFSYVCDGSSTKMRDRVSRERAARIARVMLDGAPRLLTDGATHFHTRAVRPGWSRKFTQTATIGAHIFYRQPGVRG